ncbi:MAG: biotin--[acetyl-CoA-carboxylase] ligase [Halobacteriovoraceae bacterium]|nr:biotin--[acetyl-CoA-carboxylase] ligase [Halobacteriovoraceae bacterium]
MKHLHLAKTASTQEILKEKVRMDGGQYLISTENQTQGKGRQGSAWEHFDCAIAFSFNIPPNEVLTLTSLEIGVHLANFFNGRTKLKWPNDLLNDRKEKVGGILCQLMGEQILVGIGLNLIGAPSKPNFPYPVGSILDDSSSLTKDYKQSLPLEITEYILNNRLSAEDVRSRFNDYCIHNQCPVVISNSNESDKGEFIGIGENGEALLKKEGTIKKILTGSLRLT